MIDINKEAEEYATNNKTYSEQSEIDFIAGFNSKSKQIELIRARIDSYQDCLYYVDEINSIYIHQKINELQREIEDLDLKYNTKLPKKLNNIISISDFLEITKR
jgi:hypothetical protein